MHTHKRTHTLTQHTRAQTTNVHTHVITHTHTHTCTCPGMTVGGRLVLLLGNLMEGSATLVSFARFTRFTKWPSVKKWDF